MGQRTTQAKARRDRPGPGLQPTALQFAGTSGRVVLPDDAGLAGGLDACLSGWPRRESRPRRPPARVLAAVAGSGTVTGTEGGRYDLHSRFLERPLEGLPLASTVCALVADLSQDWAETARGVTGLHGGAILLGGQLLLLTGAARAGKSTLVTRLAAAPGVTFFCDDVLPVSAAGEGIALGIAPRLRLPVPEGSAALQELARDRMILADDRYGYVRVPDQAAHGSRAPLGAILLLDRRDGEAARFHELDPAEALSTVLRQSITGYGSAAGAFARVRALTASRPCLRLVYSDLDEAAALILAGFGPQAAPPQVLAPLPAPPARVKAVQPVAADAGFQRSPGMHLRRHGTAAYLWQAGETMLWELNPVAHAVWQMLEIPGSAQELATALTGLFPDVSSERLLADVALLLADMQGAGLVSPA